LEGLAGPIHYQLTSHTFQSFQQLLDKAIVLESMRRELEELKRKAATPGPYGSHTRPRFTSPLGAPFRQGGPSGGYGKQQQYQYQPQQYQQFQCTPQQFPHPGPQTPRPGYHVSIETAQENPQVVLGMFFVNSIPTSILFDFGASHLFISAQFVAKHSIPTCPMKQAMIVKSLGGI
jgi:hypothetical protein